MTVQVNLMHSMRQALLREDWLNTLVERLSRPSLLAFATPVGLHHIDDKEIQCKLYIVTSSRYDGNTLYCDGSVTTFGPVE